MKQCPNCGKRSEDRDKFCGECGFSFGKGAGRLPRYTGIAASVVVVVALLAFLALRLLHGTSRADFIGSQVSFLEERVTAFTEDLTKDTFSSDITLSVSVDGSGEVADMLGGVLDGTSAVVRLDSSSEQLLMNAALLLKGSNVLEGFIRLTPEEIGFCVPNADETYYVGRIADMADTFGIGKNGTDLRISAAELRADIDVIVKRYQAVLAQQISKEKLTVERGREVRLSEAGKTVRCTVMTWEPDEDDITGLIHAVASALETDKEIGNLLDMHSAVENGYDDGMDMLADLAERMRGRAEEIAAAVTGDGLVWRAALDGRSQIALIAVKTDNGEIVFERATGSGECAEAFYVNSGRAEIVMITNRFSVNGSRCTGEMAADTKYGIVSVSYDLDLSRKSVIGIPYGSYTPDLRNIAPGIRPELRVDDGKSGSTDHVLTVGGLGNLTDGMLQSVGITVNTTGESSAKEPSGPGTDISGYDRQALENLLDDIGYGVGNALMDSPEIEELMELLYGF